MDFRNRDPGNAGPYAHILGCIFLKDGEFSLVLLRRRDTAHNVAFAKSVFILRNICNNRAVETDHGKAFEVFAGCINDMNEQRIEAAAVRGEVETAISYRLPRIEHGVVGRGMNDKRLAAANMSERRGHRR